MFKQVLILAGSVVAIAMVVASAAGDSPENSNNTDPEVSEQKPPAPQQQPESDESYYADEEDFTFGEPVTYSEDTESAPKNEEPSEYRPAQEDRQQVYAKPVPKPRTTPKKGEPGSKSNPIEYRPNIPLPDLSPDKAVSEPIQ
ncbi:hypothetical protein [Parasphingorhabdus sp.]|uniref:hypothetical protein n=1 Tax=Parasphingorhabdus sp. TaxID=2709688 RepID=UPI003263D22F